MNFLTNPVLVALAVTFGLQCLILNLQILLGFFFGKEVSIDPTKHGLWFCCVFLVSVITAVIFDLFIN